MSAMAHKPVTPSVTPIEGSSGVVGTLRTTAYPEAMSARTRSVKVPPTSTPMSFIPAPDALLGDCSHGCDIHDAVATGDLLPSPTFATGPRFWKFCDRGCRLGQE
jgi:hypothetical protein